MINRSATTLILEYCLELKLAWLSGSHTVYMYGCCFRVYLPLAAAYCGWNCMKRRNEFLIRLMYLRIACENAAGQVTLRLKEMTGLRYLILPITCCVEATTHSPRCSSRYFYGYQLHFTARLFDLNFLLRLYFGPDLRINYLPLPSATQS